MERQPYPSDVDDETDLFMLPYLLLCPGDAPQRNGSCSTRLSGWVERAANGGICPTISPHELVRQQYQRWMDHGCFENLVHDLRILAREHALRDAPPTVAIIDSRTLQRTCACWVRRGQAAQGE